jgi:hypothetical protein
MGAGWALQLIGKKSSKTIVIILNKLWLLQMPLVVGYHANQYRQIKRISYATLYSSSLEGGTE